MFKFRYHVGGIHVKRNLLLRLSAHREDFQPHHLPLRQGDRLLNQIEALAKAKRLAESRVRDIVAAIAGPNATLDPADADKLVDALKKEQAA